MYKVLVIEDEDIIRKGILFMVDWLKLECIVVGEGSNGQEGLEKIKELEPDIIITDIRMPFLSGIDMLEQTASDYDYEAIIISGYEEFDYAKKAITLGVTEYLLKPIDIDHLNESIENAKEKIEMKNKIKEISKEEELEPIKLLNLPVSDIIDNKTELVTKMLNYIEENYARRISITDISQIHGFSSSHLNNKFKEEVGYTFNDFLNRYRILKSIEFLSTTDMKVYEVANAVGFKDYKYFISVFKKYIGYPPIKFLNAQK